MVRLGTVRHSQQLGDGWASLHHSQLQQMPTLLVYNGVTIAEQLVPTPRSVAATALV